MSVLNENTIIGASAAGEYEIEQSLRFDKGSTPYLNRTFAAVGNRKTWTFSAWVKRAGLTDGTKTIFCSYAANNDAGYFDISFLAADTIGVHTWGTTFRVSNQLFRDTGAWYHVVLSVDTTQGTASNRLKVYVNGDEITSWSTNNAPSQNFDTAINNDKIHSVGALSSTAAFVDGYMGEVNFIDGQALTPDSFGETGTYGEWKPIEYDGTYGTNGFYLPFKQDYSVEGFSTVVYEGKGVGQYIGGTGFSPSLTWFKARNQTYDHQLFDVIRGPLNRISSNSTSVESSMTNSLAAFNTDGLTLGDTAQVNLNNGEFVAWNWDMGGTTASNTNGSITSSVRANTTYGQSIVTYSGNGSAGATVGHGLASAPNLVIAKTLDTNGYNWPVYHSGLASTSHTLTLDLTAQSGVETNKFNGTAPSSTVVTLGNHGTNLNGTNNQILYCFHDVANYSKFGSYSGSGSSGNAITTGFAPAFVMVKNTTVAQGWVMVDNTRSPTNPANLILEANDSSAESAYGTANRNIDFDANGFTIKTTAAGGTTALNASGNTYIYAAFADTREYAYWLDQSGNNNDWTSEGGLTESDLMVDSPTNNFATFNPLDNGGNTLSEGNLVLNVSSGFKLTRSTFFADSGKWYWEVLCTDSGNGFVGVSTAAESLTSRGSETSSSVNIRTTNGDSRTGAATSSYGSAFSDGDIMMLALDMDNGKFYAGKNGTWFNSGNPATSTNPAKTGLTTALSPSISLYDNEDYNANFGQDSSFAGNKTPQGNQDSNGIGDFYYAPPSGFLSLCTKSLPSVDVIPSEHFNTVLYTGNGADNHAISGVGHQPDLVWMKSRNAGRSHALVDSVRGRGSILFSDSTGLQQVPAAANNDLVSFDTDGFTVGTPERAGSTNTNNDTIVAWNWKAGGAASSNTNGSITSSVSANPAAGFSIVSYTGTGSNATIGHGLASAPTLLIVKKRIQNGSDGARSWAVYSDASVLGNAKSLYLNATNNAFTATNFWNSTTPTSSVFSIGSGTSSQETNINGDAYIAYCFHNVDGYLKTGSYVGNGNANGPFVNLGFKAKFIMIKEVVTGSGNGEWQIFDSARSPTNVVNDLIAASTTGAESTGNTYQMLDILSNGFKLRSPTLASQINMATTYIYLAFAETPFKFSNAR